MSTGWSYTSQRCFAHATLRNLPWFLFVLINQPTSRRAHTRRNDKIKLVEEMNNENYRFQNHFRLIWVNLTKKLLNCYLHAPLITRSIVRKPTSVSQTLSHSIWRWTQRNKTFNTQCRTESGIENLSFKHLTRIIHNKLRWLRIKLEPEEFDGLV